MRDEDPFPIYKMGDGVEFTPPPAAKPGAGRPLSAIRKMLLAFQEEGLEAPSEIHITAKDARSLLLDVMARTGTAFQLSRGDGACSTSILGVTVRWNKQTPGPADGEEG